LTSQVVRIRENSTTLPAHSSLAPPLIRGAPRFMANTFMKHVVAHGCSGKVFRTVSELQNIIPRKSGWRGRYEGCDRARFLTTLGKVHYVTRKYPEETCSVAPCSPENIRPRRDRQEQGSLPLASSISSYVISYHSNVSGLQQSGMNPSYLARCKND
jgi:hypothetical protein